MGKKILFIDYLYPFKPTAHNQCFLRMLRHLDGYNTKVKAEFMVLGLNCRTEDITRYRENYSRFIKRHPKIPVRLVTRTFNGKSVFSRLIELIKSCVLVKRMVRKENIDIVYAYGDNALFTLLLCRKRPGRMLYFDCRGDFRSEQAWQSAGGITLWGYKKLYQTIIPRVDKVFMVSSTIKELFPMANQACRFVVTGNYFERSIPPGKPEPGSAGPLIFAYSGGLQPYQCLDKMLALLAAYNKKYQARLLLLINDTEQVADDLLGQYGLDKDQVEIHTGLKPGEADKFLASADCGLMLREKLKLNYYAFPTKFAEYLAAGLPVVSTEHVHDTAAIIRENRLGILIDIDADLALEAEKIHAFINGDQDLRARCTDYAKNNLSWDKNISRVFQEIVG